jgi:hypothetical protein
MGEIEQRSFSPSSCQALGEARPKCCSTWYSARYYFCSLAKPTRLLSKVILPSLFRSYPHQNQPKCASICNSAQEAVSKTTCPLVSLWLREYQTNPCSHAFARNHQIALDSPRCFLSRQSYPDAPGNHERTYSSDLKTSSRYSQV